ncbi:hypothetical protein [Vibrio parahaemolyticus]|nr:hypothetical protein [Vibrio parahaemolyticus]
MARKLRLDMTVRKDGDKWTIWGLGLENRGMATSQYSVKTG